MDPESKKMIEEALTLSRENNKMLHSMRRTMIWGRVMSIIYWVFIIGSAVGAYYFIQPYVDQVTNAYGGAKSNIETVNSFIKNLQQ